MLKTEKNVDYAKQLIRKNSVYCCLKNQAIFSQSERTDKIELLPCFRFLFKKPPLHDERIF